MNKAIILSLFLIALSSCRQAPPDTKELEEKVRALETKSQNSYTPGLGEFMSNIQVHHNKLYFAGIHKNWELANFEMNEIKEALEDINRFCTDRPETKLIHTLNPAMDSIGAVIKHQNAANFEGAFSFLTTSCNNCHHNTSHGFNVIVIPTAPPFSNQSFEPKK